MGLFESTVNGIKAADKAVAGEASKRLDSLIKPIGSLGELENIAIKLAGITGKIHNKIQKKCIVVMSADNGICEEGVSTCPQSITIAQTVNILRGIAGVGVLSRFTNSDLRVVDIGIKGEAEHKELIKRKIRNGTSNMAKGPSMSMEEAVKAIETGIEIVNDLKRDGYDLIGTGEMGIGNTSTSSAILMAFTGLGSEFAVGKGAGMTEDGYAAKKKIIEKVLEINKPDRNNPLDVLSKVGGFDIAGMAGCFLGAAYNRIPIVIDGVISAAAALIAYKINPGVKDFMIPSHISAEPGYGYIMKEIGLRPYLDMGMRLGEGTGCALAFNLIEASTEIMNKMATFDEAMMNGDFMVDIR